MPHVRNLSLPGTDIYALDQDAQQNLGDEIPTMALVNGANLKLDSVDGQPLDSVEPSSIHANYHHEFAPYDDLPAPSVSGGGSVILVGPSLVIETRFEVGGVIVRLRAVVIGPPKHNNKRLRPFQSYRQADWTSPIAIMPNAAALANGCMPLIVPSLVKVGSNWSTKGYNSTAPNWTCRDPAPKARGGSTTINFAQLLNTYTLAYPPGCTLPLHVARGLTPPTALSTLYICPIGKRGITRITHHAAQKRTSNQNTKATNAANAAAAALLNLNRRRKAVVVGSAKNQPAAAVVSSSSDLWELPANLAAHAKQIATQPAPAPADLLDELLDDDDDKVDDGRVVGFAPPAPCPFCKRTAAPGRSLKSRTGRRRAPPY